MDSALKAAAPNKLSIIYQPLQAPLERIVEASKAVAGLTSSIAAETHTLATALKATQVRPHELIAELNQLENVVEDCRKETDGQFKLVVSKITETREQLKEEFSSRFEQCYRPLVKARHNAANNSLCAIAYPLIQPLS